MMISPTQVSIRGKSLAPNHASPVLCLPHSVLFVWNFVEVQRVGSISSDGNRVASLTGWAERFSTMASEEGAPESSHSCVVILRMAVAVGEYTAESRGWFTWDPPPRPI